jgi:L-seryl-tRNA(Ser) seleniumtransferase
MQALERDFGRTAVVDALRAEAAALRTELAGGAIADIVERLEAAAAQRVRSSQAASLRTVINATGVILHTNLGRAPLSDAAAQAVAAIAAGYANLEFDLEQGARGKRDVHAERLLCALTGAEAACVVNNNAAATMLGLAALAAGREVIVSRGELVEIGGGFRVPDVMAQSGAVLREVGTTNRTRAADYAAAIGERTALILRVHRSNFRIEGFTEQPPLAELVALGRRFKVPVVEDLGSGWLTSLPIEALAGEPSVRDSIATGVDAVMFSGDKLLGGPQAGIIAGSRVTVDPIKRHPLMRALRVDKLTYAALEATLQAYAAERWDEVPVLRMLRLTAAEIGRRAERLAAGLRDAGLRATVIDGNSTVGGGSAPGSEIPTKLVALEMPAPATLARLRALDTPVIARIENDRVVLDLRTVAPSDDERLADLVARACRA